MTTVLLSHPSNTILESLNFAHIFELQHLTFVLLYCTFELKFCCHVFFCYDVLTNPLVPNSANTGITTVLLHLTAFAAGKEVRAPL